MKIIKPKKLQKGNTIAIVAVSGQIKEYNNIENAKLYFEKLGYKVKISVSCKTSHRYMAGISTQDCIDELHNAFLAEDVDAILCARGGFGTIKLINDIDWKIIKNNPKIFAGYSDISILLNLIYKNTGLITFHSPMANGDFANDVQEYTKNSFFCTLEGKTKSYQAENFTAFNTGSAKGKLFGGNLSTIVSLCGTDFIPNQDLILFLEDLNEPIYKIDKMLTQLFNTENIKKRVTGIAIGEFLNIEDKKILNEVIQEFALKLNIPMCDGFKITHGKIKDTIPIGTDAELDADNGLIKLTEEYIS